MPDFSGAWRLDRRIEDRLSGQEIKVNGRAAFTPDTAGLVYREEAQLHLPGQAPIRAERGYLWRFSDDAGGEVSVFFDDGRPFHRFCLAQKAEGSDHPCGDDLYRVAYDFSDWPHWQAVWTVVGPRKDYTSTTRYAPLK